MISLKVPSFDGSQKCQSKSMHFGFQPNFYTQKVAHCCYTQQSHLNGKKDSKKKVASIKCVAKMRSKNEATSMEIIHSTYFVPLFVRNAPADHSNWKSKNISSEWKLDANRKQIWQTNKSCKENTKYWQTKQKYLFHFCFGWFLWKKKKKKMLRCQKWVNLWSHGIEYE